MNYCLGGFLLVTIILMAQALPYPQSLGDMPGSGSGNSAYSTFLQSLKNTVRRIKSDDITAILDFVKYIEENGVNDKARCIFIKGAFNIVTDEVGELVYSILGPTLDKIRNFGFKLAGDACNESDFPFISKIPRMRDVGLDFLTVLKVNLMNLQANGVNSKTLADLVESETWMVVNEFAEGMDPLIHPVLETVEKIGYATAETIRKLDVIP